MTTNTPGVLFGIVHVDLPSGVFFRTTISRTSGGVYWMTCAQYDYAGVYEGTHEPVKVSVEYATSLLVDGGIWPADMLNYGKEEVA